MRRWVMVLVACLGLPALAERINHAGRILGPEVAVSNATHFNTAEASAILSAMQIFPRDNAWNEDISQRPVLSNSAAIMSSILTNPAANQVHVSPVEPFVLVPPQQPPVAITFVLDDESDPGPYPIPTNLPVEPWPMTFGATATLNEAQQGLNGTSGGDRHAMIVQPGSNLLWEIAGALLTNGAWQGYLGAKWNMASNTLRTLNILSALPSGTAMLPGLVRYDELARGEIEHALVMSLARVRGLHVADYIYPATHRGPHAGTAMAPYGTRLRLRSSFVEPGNWSAEEKAVARALKKYGAIVSDLGTTGFLTYTADSRITTNMFVHLNGGSPNNIGLTNFDVIVSTGETEGPRSPGAPTVDVGPDLRTTLDAGVDLAAVVTYTNADPLALVWTNYSGPGAVTFGSETQAATEAQFSTAGVYTLRFGAANGIHMPAYDAVVVTVVPSLQVAATVASTGATVTWTGGDTSDTFVVEGSGALIAPDWQPVATNTAGGTVILPTDATTRYFRIRQP